MQSNFYNGQCFCLDIHVRVTIFDPKEAFMVESDGELLSATISEEGQVCIYKLHSSKRDWTGPVMIYSRHGEVTK